jgi:hypothetical protein
LHEIAAAIFAARAAAVAAFEDMRLTGVELRF